MNLKNQNEVQLAIKSWLNVFMEENNISAFDMINAINSTLVDLKDLVILEIIKEQIDNARNTESDSQDE